MLHRSARVFAILAGYGFLFFLFDTQATFFEVMPGVSLWYPSAGLNLALVLIFGVAYAPAIFVALLISGLWISEPAIPLRHLLLPDALIAIGNAGAAWGLRRVLRGRTLFAPGAIVWLVGGMAALALWNSVMAVGSYALTGLSGYTFGSALAAIPSWWLGDWAGMLTLAPLLLLAPLAIGSVEVPWCGPVRFEPLRRLRGMAELGAEVFAVVASVYVAFIVHGAPYPLYLCFLPLLWVALRHGLARSALGILIVNLGAAYALHGRGDAGSILELQLFIVALALTGLFLGALVSERARAFGTLRTALQALDGTGASESARISMHDDALHIADQLRSKQAQLADSADVLQHQNARKDQLFSIISHDLKNQIGTAAGLAEVIASDAPSMDRGTLVNLAQHINRVTWQAHDMLVNLLEWTQMHVDGARPNPADRAAPELIGPALEQVEQAAQQKEITIERVIPSDLTIRGYPTLLQSVVRNLVANAIKFTDAGGTITVEATGREADVLLCVRDDGTGMTADELDGLFSLNRSASRTGTAGEKGTGLGLVLCREIVEQHGGSIWAESEVGVGSAFYVTVPHAPVWEHDAPEVPAP